MPVHADFHEKTAFEPQLAPPVAGPLDPYVPSADKPWNARRVAHLYRRLGFGATLEQIQAGLQMTPSALVDQLLDDASNLGTPLPPYWANYTSEDYDADPDLRFTHYDELRRRWLADMLGPEGVRAKLAFFWHNHFVTSLDVVSCTSYLWNYYSLLNEYSLGNFRTFTREIGQSAAMLVYLNGNQNEAGEPNENYARELMELFTMGENNGYTQIDIVEMARALTGWQAQMYACTPPYYDPAKHDNNSKTIFGVSQNFGFTTAHNLIFTQRATQVSEYIAGKLYKNFVYQKVNPEVVDGLAQTFRAGNWELLPLMKQLFKSEHFFDDLYVNARIKNPIEAMLPLLKMAGATYPAEVSDNALGNIFYWGYQSGQELLNPPNVAGWPGHHAWINESTLTGRWNFSSYVVYQISQNDTLKENLRTLALTLTNESNSPVTIVEALVEFFLGQELDPVHLQAAVAYFKSGVPENYYLDGSWNLYWGEAPLQVVNLLYYLVRLPEFQLT
jgi:uncharacterized protein (DUF1800 family)